MKEPGARWNALTGRTPQPIGAGRMVGSTYYARRGVAILLACALTGYSAWLSWAHFHSLLGPLVSVSAAALLVLASHGHRYRRALWVLGFTAAIMSAAVVADRVAATDAQRLQSAKDANHPRAVAQRALDDAKAEAKAAGDAAASECQTGRGKRCAELQRRESDARARVETARAKVTGAGAEVDLDPTVNLFGSWAATYRTVLPLGLPMWLEIAAPVLMAYGFAPLPRNPSQSGLQSQADCARNQPRKPRRKGAKAKPGTRAYWIARLGRERPDLAALVRAGEMSVNLAAIKAGWRKSPVRLVS